MFITMAVQTVISLVSMEFILCGCRAVKLDRQAIHVCSLLRPLRDFGTRSTLFTYGYSVFGIKFASTAGGLFAGA